MDKLVDGEQQDITRLLREWQSGDRGAGDELIEQLYPELRALARRHLRNENDTLTLQVTDLVSEAYLRLNQQKRCDWNSRTHFLAIAATLVRRIVIDYVKNKRRAKRGGQDIILSMEEVGDQVATPAMQIDALALDGLLDELETVDPICAEMVKLRYFGGLKLDEVADVMQCSVSTVSRDWTFARAWLHKRLTA